MSHRISSVDYAKAIGMCLVVYGHVARGLISAGLVGDAALLLQVDAVIYSFHMPLFFFLSGVFLFDSLHKSGAGGYALNKLDTVLYPFVVWSLLQGGLEVLLSAYTNGSATVGQVLSLWWAPRAQFWFLYALFFCALVAAVVCGLLPWRRRAKAGALLGLGVLVFGFAPSLAGTAPTRLVAGYLVYFAAGAVWGLWAGQAAVGRVWVVGAALLLAAAVQGVLLAALVPGGRWLDLLAGLSGLGAVVVVSVWLARFNLPWLALLGRYSLAVYLMHVVAGSGVRIVLDRGLGLQSVALHLVVGCVVGVLLPLWLARRLDAAGVRWPFVAPLTRWSLSARRAGR